MRDRLDAIIADVTFALRQLRRSPVLALAAILCFALGIGVNSAIFSIVNGVLIRPLPYRDADRIVVINEGLPKMNPGMGRISAAELLDYRELDGRVFQATAIYEPRSYTVRAPDGSLERVQGALVSGSFLRVLGTEPVLGHIPETWSQNAANPNASLATAEVIVSHAFWRTRLGGDSSIIGKTMPLGNAVATVAGVMPPGVQFPIGGIGVTPAEIFLPYELTPQVMARRADNYGTWAFGRLADGVSVEGADAAVSRVATGLPNRYPEFYKAGTGTVIGGVQTLRDAITGSVRQPLLVLLGAVCLVLLIACLNVSSLLVARSVSRRREIAVRRAIGASRSRLAQQFLTESLVLVITGGIVGLLFGRYGSGLLARLAPNGALNGYDIGLDWRVVTATAAATGLTALVFSVLPGLAGRDDLQTTLREGNPRQRDLSRSGLVVAEIAIALLLTVGAGLMVRSFLHLRDVDPGYNAERLVTFRVTFPQSRYPTHAAAITGQQVLTQRLAAIPGVRAVSSASDMPAADPSWIVFTPDPAIGPLPEKTPIGSNNLVQPGYFETMGIALRVGRTFNTSDIAGREPVAIIGETLAKQRFGGTSAVGRRLKWGGLDSPQPWRTIVGVVADVKQSGLTQEEPTPAIYMPAAQLDSGPVVSIVRGQSYLLRTAGDPRAAFSAIRRAVREFDGLMPITGLSSMDDLLVATIADRRFNMFLLGAFAAVALTLAAVGIYGLIAFSVAQRTRELGIRIALGALPRDVLLLVMRQGATLVLTGIVVGSIGAIVSTRWMRSMLFQVDPLDPLTFAVVAVALAAVAIGATWAPALRAARVSPVTAMRTD
ncbi:MAG TPA: ABC transporter permease [Gemmatimonadales bacterium]|nr:ABC transporter permease [Gemmatimonadales bacterium]